MILGIGFTFGEYLFFFLCEKTWSQQFARDPFGMVVKITKEVEKEDNGKRGCDKKKNKAMPITSRKTKKNAGVKMQNHIYNLIY